MSTLALPLVACSPRQDDAADAPEIESNKGQHKSAKLPESDLERLTLEYKNSEFAIYNGSDWFILWADLQMSARSAANELSSRRFRLYPKKAFSGEQAPISPYTTRAVDFSDVRAWYNTYTNIEDTAFVAAAGYKE